MVAILVCASPHVDPESSTSDNLPWKDGHGGVSLKLVLTWSWFSGLGGHYDGSPGVRIGEGEVGSSILKLSGDGLGQGCEGPAYKALEGSLLDDLDHTVEVYVSDHEANPQKHSHRDISLAVS